MAPGQSINIPGIVSLPAAALGDQEKFSTCVFSSESVEKSVPLHKISIYHQYLVQAIPHHLGITLRYVNHSKTEDVWRTNQRPQTEDEDQADAHKAPAREGEAYDHGLGNIIKSTIAG